MKRRSDSSRVEVASKPEQFLVRIFVLCLRKEGYEGIIAHGDSAWDL